jgi:adenylate cyclase
MFTNSLKDKLKPFLIPELGFIPLGILLGFGLSLTSPLLSANQIITDQLQGSIQARSDVVIVGLDDKSLQEIGAWPWNRDVFATALTNLEKAKPRAVGLDVLFLESRQGDDKLNSFLSQTNVPTIFGAKDIGGGQVLTSPILPPNNSKVTSALIDFNTDADAKIRTANLNRKIGESCFPSFSTELFRQSILSPKLTNCSDSIIKIRDNSFNQNYRFEYSKNKFNNISFVDLYNNKVDQASISNKIVLIGSTSKDLKNNLNDNFINVFGEQISGVEIHANVLNSLLENVSRQEISPLVSYPVFILIYLLFLSIWIKWPKLSLAGISLIFGLIILNIVGVFLFGLGYIWPFITFSFGFIGSFGGFIVYQSLTRGKQNKFITRAFGQYLSPALLAQVIANPEKLKLGGSKKVISVLFSDIRGFTSLAETMSPEQLVHLTNLYLESAGQVILDQKGTIDKYIGDCIMALWNAPLDNEKHALLAMQTALLMEKSLHFFNQEHPEFKDLKIGIGINTGDMIVGNIGSSKRFEYTVLGDNVNLASRLEGLTKKYGVQTLVSKSTLEIAGIVLDGENEFVGKFDGGLYRQVDKVQVKGKNTGIEIYEIIEDSKLNQELLEKYNLAFKLYTDKKWVEAKKQLSLLKDSVSIMLLNRLENMSATQLESFNGTYIWDEK